MTGDSATAAGLFITFEGGDGSGKTTQIQRVRQWFELRGRTVLVTREPGGTKLGLQLRQLVQHGPEDVDARTEALLYAADRAYHVSTVVRPALAAGRVVLGDRYIDSSVAYQGAARALGVEEIRSLSEWATHDLRPDLTFLLDLPPEVGARRATGAPDRLERESSDFHERVRHEYLQLAEKDPRRIVVIDAVGTPDQVFSEIRGVLEERFGASAPRAGGPAVVGGPAVAPAGGRRVAGEGVGGVAAPAREDAADEGAGTGAGDGAGQAVEVVGGAGAGAPAREDAADEHAGTGAVDGAEEPGGGVAQEGADAALPDTTAGRSGDRRGDRDRADPTDSLGAQIPLWGAPSEGMLL